ncbi:hypothetical protein Bbelb_389440 [Branchiostoma belcheri]|nr:hypothetical protein Bbelb_389440 [Branchiostoma belcheri]
MAQAKLSEMIRPSLVDRGDVGSLSGPESFKARARVIRAGNVITSLGGPDGVARMVVARKARSQEKEELTVLNNRFASYIQKMRFLQQRNRALEAQILQLQSTEMSADTKTLYEKETRDLRTLVDELSDDKARMALERDQWKERAEEYKRKWEEESAWHAELNTEVAKLNKNLNAVTLIRVDLQSKIASMKEEIDFMVTVHKQELKQLQDQLNQSLSIVAVDEIPEAGPDVISELYELRQLYEDFCRDVRARCEEKFTGLELERERDSKTMLAARGALITSRKEVSELRGQLNTVMTETVTETVTRESSSSSSTELQQMRITSEAELDM